jgi:hypothetical protein
VVKIRNETQKNIIVKVLETLHHIRGIVFHHRG